MATYQEALQHLDRAAKEVFGSDSRVQALGITADVQGYHYRAIRNVSKVVPFNAGLAPVFDVANVAVAYTDAFNDVQSELRVPFAGPGSPTAASLVPEQARHRPLVCGLQIQNFDDDVRQNHIQQNFIVIGTAGCYVRLGDGSIAILSNNHVVAAENRGQSGQDRVLQPGSSTFDARHHVATLGNFVALQPSPAGARPALGNVVFNVVDAGAAPLMNNVAHQQAYLPGRRVPSILGTAPARVGDKVFKVGRTTGLTFGEVTDVHTIVGPVPYGGVGDVWFRDSITIQGDNGTMFSDRGDSGSAIVKTGTGELIGLLYAGNGSQTFACPIGEVFKALSCSL
jgi:hypothetical protein